MPLIKEDITALLDSKKIKYEIVEHKPVFTIDEMLECDMPYPDLIAKNLFIRDDKKRKYYLIFLPILSEFIPRRIKLLRRELIQKTMTED